MCLSYPDTKMPDGRGIYLIAIALISKNTQDEQEQADWLKNHSPRMLAQLWPKIQSAVAANAPPFSL
jgi:hypothetical protein